MATVVHDSEFMTTYRAASPIKPGGKFLSFRDGSIHPAVLCQGENNTIFVVLTNPETGQRATYDATKFFGLSGSIIDFELRQYKDQTSFLFSTSHSASENGVHFFNGITPEELWSLPESKLFTGRVSTVVKLFLSDLQDDDGVPALFFTTPRPGYSDEVLLRPLNADIDKNILSPDNNWKLAGNITDVLAVAVGVSSYGPGAFVLYKGHQNGKRYVQFRNNVVGGELELHVDFPVHDRSECLGTYVNNETDCTALVVAGEEISLYLDDEYVHEGAKPAATVPVTSSVTSLHVAQHEDDISIWYTDKAKGAHYYNTKHSKFDKGQMVQFLPNGAGKTISGLIWEYTEQGSIVQTLMTMDDKSHLAVWQQDLESRFWSPHPYHVDAPDKAIPVTGYVTRLHAKNPTDPSTIVGCQMELVATGVIHVYANGKATMIGPKPSLHRVNGSGVLNLIVPSDEITCQQIQVNALLPKNGGRIAVSTGWFDPAAKVVSKLSTIKTGQDLINTGMAPNLPRDQADEAAKSISNAMKAYHNFASGPSSKPSPSAVQVPDRPPQFWSIWSLWDGLRDILNKGLDSLRTGLQLVDDAFPDGPWKLIVHLAEQPLYFLIDCASTALAAADFVVKIAHIAWDAFKTFFEFLLDWDSIKMTARSIKAWMDSGFEWATEKVDDLDRVVDQFCDRIIGSIDQRTSPDAISANNVPGKTSQRVTDAQNSVGYHYGFDLLLQGVNTMAESSSFIQASVDDDLAQKPDYSIIQDAFELVQNLLKDVKSTLENIFTDVSKWSAGSLTTADVFSKITDDLLVGIMKVAKDAVHAILKAFKELISTLHSWTDKNFTIPVLTDLWLWLTGETLSFAGVISFVLAFPMTLLSKAITNRPPPDLRSMSKNSWDLHALESGRVSQAISGEDISLFGGLLLVVAEDGEAIVEAAGHALDSIKEVGEFDIIHNVNFLDLIILVLKGATRGYPWEKPWSEHRMKDEHCFVYGTEVTEILWMVTCMGFRKFTSLEHSEMALANAAGGAVCMTVISTLRMIIAGDELKENEKSKAILNSITAALAWIAAGGELEAAGFAVAEQTELEVGALGVAAFADSLILGFEISEIYEKYNHD